MNKIIIDMPTPKLAEAFKDELENKFGCPVEINKEDRHDSDEEELKKEQKDLRNYDFLRGKHE